MGPRPVMIAGLAVEALGLVTLSRIQTLPQAVLAASVVVVGTIVIWPASTALLTRLVPREAREHVYGLNFMLLNAGLGLGGLISSTLVDLESVASFQRLYLIDALAYAVYIVVLLTLPRGTGTLADAATEADGDGEPRAGQRPSWALVLRDRTLLWVVGVSTLAITFGYAQLEAGLAAYAVDVAEVPVRVLGWAYAANTAAIVVGQLVTLRLIAGRRRSSLLAVCAAGWSLSWVVIALAGATEGWLSAAAIVAGLGLFGAAETIWAPVAPAIVNDLAVAELRGRYNALHGMTWTFGSIVGPATAGMLLGHHLAGVWVAAVVGGTALAAVLFAGLRRRLTDAQDGVAARAGDHAGRPPGG
ncbi:MAG: MFS transporter [Nocardioides sp.]